MTFPEDAIPREYTLSTSPALNEVPIKLDSCGFEVTEIDATVLNTPVIYVPLWISKVPNSPPELEEAVSLSKLNV